MSIVPSFIGRKQNKITLYGVKYKAQEQAGCTGCAFGSVESCDQPISVEGRSLCARTSRKDGRSIVWIKKD
uniref:Uncharacterized protein n=1 Tax=feces metagenome TaxID=1861841 RepID=A0A7M2QNA3_9ZZZZ